MDFGFASKPDLSRVSLASYYYPCVANQPICDTLVLLHGWGCDSRSWDVLIPALQKYSNVIAIDLPGFGKSPVIAEFTLDAVLDLIAAHLPEKSILIGWSLGGMLAVQLASRYPQKISHIITLAANAKFVVGDNFDVAMLCDVNKKFNQNFAADPHATLKMFAGLMVQGDLSERALLKKTRAFISFDNINKNWLQALGLLSVIDNRKIFTQLIQPGLHIFAERDALVPVAAARSLALLNPLQQTSVVSSAAHALHWGNPEQVVQLITEFIAPPIHEKKMINKKQMAQSFSKAAATYDSVAGLQRTAGEYLLQKINTDAAAEVVLDLGCGTGYFTPHLHERFPQANIIGVDIAEGMLRFAQSNYTQQKKWLCADADFLPFSNNTIDIIYSNFSLQWCENLPHLLAELHRVLKPNGKLLFTTLGEKTLHELRSSWAKVDSAVHVNSFHSNVDKILEQCQFRVVECECNLSIMEFGSLADLMRSLKYLGAHNVNHGRIAGLTGKSKIQALKKAYEDFRCNNVLPASYEIFYIKAQK